MKFYLILVLPFFCSCSDYSGAKDNDEIISVIDSFACYYFNLDIPSSVKFCTEESGKWLRFYASNIRQEDLDIMAKQNEKASFDIEDVVFLNDTSSMVVCNIFNYPDIESLEAPPVIIEHGVCRIPLVKRDSRWKVKMEGLLRSERQSRD